MGWTWLLQRVTSALQTRLLQHVPLRPSLFFHDESARVRALSGRIDLQAAGVCAQLQRTRR